MPEISVIVPAYNVEAYLCRCVDSILRQSFQDFELILVDDGSPDKCPEICDGYAQKDQRVHVIHRENGGLSAARNSGLDWVMEHSQSRWITFVDSDDWIHRDYLQRLLKGTEQPDVTMSVCGYAHVNRLLEDASLPPAKPLILNGETAYAEHYGSCITACCKLIRRELLGTLRFPVGKLHEDAFITHRLTLSGGRVAVLEENLYYYYENPGSITRKAWTPKRLEQLEAHEVRLQYLRQQGFQKALTAEKRVTAETIYEHVEALAYLRDREHAPYLKMLRKRLRNILKENKNLIPLDMESVWMYLMAWHTKYLWYLGKKAQDLWHRRRK